MIPRKLRFLVAAALLAPAGSLVPSSTAAQLMVPMEFGAYYLSGSANIAEMSHPQGSLFALRIIANDRLSLRASFSWKGDEGARRGNVCTLYEPPIQCRQEDVTSETTIRGVEFGVNFRQPVHQLFELDLGLGASMNRVSIQEVTESGRTSSVLTQHSGQPGLFVALSGRFLPFYHTPVMLEVGFTQHVVRLNACSENEWRYLPFCGNRSLRQLQVGLAYRTW